MPGAAPTNEQKIALAKRLEAIGVTDGMGSYTPQTIRNWYSNSGYPSQGSL